MNKLSSKYHHEQLDFTQVATLTFRGKPPNHNYFDRTSEYLINKHLLYAVFLQAEATSRKTYVVNVGVRAIAISGN